MTRCGHDLEVVVTIFSPVVDAGMPKIMKCEILDSRSFADHPMCPPDMAWFDRFSAPMKHPVTIEGPHL